MRYLPRAIVNYDAGGQSATNLTFTRGERLQVRLQYSNLSAYRIGEFGYRLRRKLLNKFGHTEFTPYADS